MVLVLVPFNYLKMYSRAVKTFLSSRLIMNSWQLWNLAPKAKFLRAKASRDIFLVSEMSRAFHNIIGLNISQI